MYICKYMASRRSFQLDGRCDILFSMKSPDSISGGVRESKEAASEFRIGDRVKVLGNFGEVETNWKVESIMPQNKEGRREVVLAQSDNMRRIVSVDDLAGWQKLEAKPPVFNPENKKPISAVRPTPRKTPELRQLEYQKRVMEMVEKNVPGSFYVARTDGYLEPGWSLVSVEGQDKIILRKELADEDVRNAEIAGLQARVDELRNLEYGGVNLNKKAEDAKKLEQRITDIRSGKVKAIDKEASLPRLAKWLEMAERKAENNKLVEEINKLYS